MEENDKFVALTNEIEKLKSEKRYLRKKCSEHKREFMIIKSRCGFLDAKCNYLVKAYKSENDRIKGNYIVKFLMFLKFVK